MALLEAMTESGLVVGLPANNQVVSVFKGIPFARAPRWRAPEPAEPWEGALEAYRFPPICPQARYVSEGGGGDLASREFYVHDYPMAEECLYLNIWTPAKSPDEKLPVAVYIHGGGFETGFSYLNAYDGEGFAKRGVIMVSIAYRLGVFGFFAHPDLAAEDPHGSTGNYGTMDQVAALEWVHRNIAAFGGDPDRVTIFGQSAGGRSVQNLCNCPQAKGLFVGAIMQSCGGLGAAGVDASGPVEDSCEQGRKFLEYLGLSLEEARALPFEELEARFEEYKGPGYSGLFMPCVDGYVMPEAPVDYFRAGKQPDVPYMLGCALDDLRNPLAPAPSDEQVRRDAQAFGDAADEYLALVPADPEERRAFYENRAGEDMLAGNKAWCENQLDLKRCPAYEYYFTYVPPGDAGMGAHHSVEHHYVFQTLVRSFRPYTGFDYDLSNELADYWANFVKFGNPNGEGPETWRPYTREAPEALIIGKERVMASVPERPYVTFQKNLALSR